MRATGAQCFDAAYYAEENADLADEDRDLGPEHPGALWRHFLYHGQFDYRPFRWGWGRGGARGRSCWGAQGHPRAERPVCGLQAGM